MAFSDLKALAFDVFGTVVNLAGSIAEKGDGLIRTWGFQANWHAVTAAWLDGYKGMIEQVGEGEVGWAHADTLALRSLDKALLGTQLLEVSENQKAELLGLWGDLKPYPDVRQGLLKLRTKYFTFALTNGTAKTMARIAQNGGLQWDGIFSAGSVRAYKPDPRVYQMFLDGVGLSAGEVMMVASHRFDLDAAKRCGWATAFIHRPEEPAGRGTTVPDVSCSTLVELSRFLS